MRGTNDRRSQTAEEARSASAEAVPSDAKKAAPAERAPTDMKNSLTTASVAQPAHQGQHDVLVANADPGITSRPPETGPPSHLRRKWLLLAGAVVGLAAGGYFLRPWVVTALNTVSTDDAYVNGHVTFVAPRVAGQVSKVLVDDNYRVKKGDVLVELDTEPYHVQVAIKKAAVEAAETESGRRPGPGARPSGPGPGQSLQARTRHRGRGQPDRQSARQRGHSQQPEGDLATGPGQSQAGRESAGPSGAISQGRPGRAPRDIQGRGGGRRTSPPGGLRRCGSAWDFRPSRRRATTWPKCRPSLDQNFSAVRQALGDLLHSAAQFGYFPTSWTATPKEAIESFYKQDPEGDLNRIYARLIPQAPAIKQAEAKLRQAQRDLDQAELNLRYCDIVSEIDGVVTGRNVNPGNNVQVGQSLMAVRSLTEIWIDANFKETQLANLRIGQRGALRGGHVRQAARVRGPNHGLHHGDRSNPGPAAAAERHGQFREDRPAAAGPDRTDRLRSRQGPLVRRIVGRPIRLLQGAAQRAVCRGLPATDRPVGATFDYAGAVK